jgi:hypothetical protein
MFSPFNFNVINAYPSNTYGVIGVAAFFVCVFYLKTKKLLTTKQKIEEP